MLQIEQKIGSFEIFSIYSRKTDSNITRKFAMCQCVCGKYVEVELRTLTGKFNHSCGCQHKRLFTGNKSAGFKGHGEIHLSYIQRLQGGAKIRNIEWNVDIKDLWELFLKQERKCKLSGERLCFSTQKQQNKGFEQTASLDRIDSSKSYTIDNVQWIHKDANYFKSNISEIELKLLCKEISDHHNNPVKLPYNDKINQFFSPVNWKGYGEIGLSKFHEIKRHAIERNVEFNVTIQHIWEIFIKQHRQCVLTGRLIEFGNRNGGNSTASLTMINSDKGFIEGNVQWVHKDINWLKHDIPQGRIIELAQKLI